MKLDVMLTKLMWFRIFSRLSGQINILLAYSNFWWKRTSGLLSIFTTGKTTMDKMYKYSYLK